MYRSVHVKEKFARGMLNTEGMELLGNLTGKGLSIHNNQSGVSVDGIQCK
ncbi:hypothetical protein [Hahella ganghwensis]|nr:hypothetical protein [Hahella ganghwensis]